jgi:hypothetical protein
MEAILYDVSGTESSYFKNYNVHQGKVFIVIMFTFGSVICCN